MGNSRVDKSIFKVVTVVSDGLSRLVDYVKPVVLTGRAPIPVKVNVEVHTRRPGTHRRW